MTQPSDDAPDQPRLEREELLIVLRDLTHLQLIARDQEIGLRAELAQARIDVANAHSAGAAAVDNVRRSTTWKVGRVVTMPLGFVKRVLRRSN